jgi:hypothetical protein
VPVVVVQGIAVISFVDRDQCGHSISTDHFQQGEYSMQRHVLRFTVSAILTGLALSASAIAGAPLLTPDQKEAQSQAISLGNEPAVQAARAAAIKRYQTAPPAQLADGRATLSAAVDEAVYGTLLTLTNDPAHPKVLWSEALPYDTGAYHVAGGRYGGDDPDRIYRAIAVDPTSRYEIRGRRLPHASLDFSFEAISGPALWGKAKVALQAKDIDVAADGTFVVTADATPANDRRNHLQLPPGTANILVRDTLDNWALELPNELSVHRLNDGAVQSASRETLVQRAPLEVQKSIDESLKFIAGVWKNPPNHLFPVVRGLSDGVQGGVVAVNRFRLRSDEALIIKLDPLGAKYVGIEVTDPWMRSAGYAQRSTSLNDTQAEVGADASLTYVLSDQDPGIHNWLDTGGLHDGILLVRWELLSGVAQADKAVREIRVVKLSNLAAALPAGATRIEAAQRQQWLAARKQSYERRLAQE